MSSPQQFNTIAHEARGKAGKSHDDSQESGARGLYGFTGLLIGSIAGMIKKLAFNETNPAAPEPGNLELDEDARSLPSNLAPNLNSQRQGPSSGENDSEIAAQLPHQPLGTATHFQHALFRDEAPGPLRDTQLAPPSVAAIALAPANDNSGLRLPLSRPESAAAQATSASVSSGSTTSQDGELDQSGDNTAPEPVGEKPATGADDADTTRERNRAPVVTGSVSLGQLNVNTALAIGLTDLLPHATDPDGDALAVTNLVATRGELVVGDNNSWHFTPAHDDVGEVTFSYSITDGEFSISQTATLDLFDHSDVHQFGTSRDDVLVGSESSDDIAALGGSDIIDALAGDDIIDGGDGDDIILAGSGDDLIFAGGGDDFIDAGDGNDIVFAGSGNDIVFAGSGDDVVHGEAGNDTLNVGSGNDVADGGDGDDVFLVTHAPVSGTAPPTQLPVNSSDAAIETKIPFDSQPATVTQAIVASPGDGNDTYDGGAGNDTLDLGATTAAAVVDLSAGTAVGSDIGTDTLKNIENVVTGSGNDTIVANTAQNLLTGGAGEDTFVFTTTADSAPTPEAMDTITDFEVGDKIDVSKIDGDEKAEGKQSFEFKGKADHFEKAAEIIYKYEKHDDGEHTIVSGNDDDDMDADFSIDLFGHHDLKLEDFHGLS